MDSYELAAFQSGLPIVQIDSKGRSIEKKFKIKISPGDSRRVKTYKTQ